MRYKKGEKQKNRKREREELLKLKMGKRE